jgi:hypothetical protein
MVTTLKMFPLKTLWRAHVDIAVGAGQGRVTPLLATSTLGRRLGQAGLRALGQGQDQYGPGSDQNGHTRN